MFQARVRHVPPINRYLLLSRQLLRTLLDVKASVIEILDNTTIFVRTILEDRAMTQPLRSRPPETDEDTQILDMIDRWVARELKPIVREYDHEDRYPAGIVEQMKELGLFGATISPEYGGLGLSAATYARIIMS